MSCKLFKYELFIRFQIQIFDGLYMQYLFVCLYMFVYIYLDNDVDVDNNDVYVLIILK